DSNNVSCGDKYSFPSLCLWSNITQNYVFSDSEFTFWFKRSKHWSCDTAFCGPCCCNRKYNTCNCCATDFKTTYHICIKHSDNSFPSA
ncbi:hypothetical protein HispidOSU_029090, partial [Sigmodon hispidus]